MKNRKRRLFAPKQSSSSSKSLVKRRFDCVFSLKLTILGQKFVISSIFKQALIPDQSTDKFCCRSGISIKYSKAHYGISGIKQSCTFCLICAIFRKNLDLRHMSWYFLSIILRYLYRCCRFYQYFFLQRKSPEASPTPFPKKTEVPYLLV